MINSKKKIEVMSPVGSFESLMAAIQAGADSVYFGVGQLNMRSRSSQNFDLNDLAEIAKRCSEHGVKSYLALNTVIYDSEMETMKCYVDAAKKAGISALIASDLSVIQYARSQNVDIHISTQCNISNKEAVRYYARFADVMVLAREVNVRQMKSITKFIEDEQIKGPSGELVQIEVFAHGALCMAISGKCYLSLDNFGASANRGACYQPCRRGYIVRDKDQEIELEIDNEYIMSPKDLKTIQFLDQLLDAGVRVLKIEGRGRSPEYVKTVTQCYKEAVNAYQSDSFTDEKIVDWNARLSTVYNRGFWNGYYLGQTIGEWTQRYGSLATKTKVYVGLITNYFSKLNVAEIRIDTGDLSIGDELKIMGATTGVAEEFVDEIRVDLKPVTKTEKGVICSIPTKNPVRRGDKVYKVVDAEE
ncbi:MAG: U32 family peptidase [Bacteroidales bacterium]|nr:U32 family peptidase [Bacteroidales bacterium]